MQQALRYRRPFFIGAGVVALGIALASALMIPSGDRRWGITVDSQTLIGFILLALTSALYLWALRDLYHGRGNVIERVRPRVRVREQAGREFASDAAFLIVWPMILGFGTELLSDEPLRIVPFLAASALNALVGWGLVPARAERFASSAGP
jgi:hypothetical protein